MLRSNGVWALAAAAAGICGLIGVAVPQENRPQADRGPGGRDQMGDRMAEFRRAASERMRETMGATEDEWKVLQPKIEKVQTLSRDARGGMGMGFRMLGPGGGPGGRGPGGRGRGGRDATPPAEGADRQQSDVEKTMAELQKLLQDKESKAEDIKAALTAYREARAKVREELEKSQKDLREIVTVRQEAMLVSMAVLD